MNDITEKTERFSTDLLRDKLDPNYLYHNLRHTQRVVKSAIELVNFYKLNDEEKSAIISAAWLHDLGYTKSKNDHEEEGVLIAEKFLKDEGASPKFVALVSSLIRATKKEHKPKDLLEKIINDADCSHFGQNSYLETTDLLREELSLLGVEEYTPKKWRDENIKVFRTKQTFYTDYARDNWQEGMDKNLKKLLKEKKAEKEIAKKEELKAKYKTESPDRGIQTLFRVTLKNHITLSDIADTKANILLSVNAIIISLALSNLLPKLDNPSNSFLIYPLLFSFFLALYPWYWQF